MRKQQSVCTTASVLRAHRLTESGATAARRLRVLCCSLAPHTHRPSLATAPAAARDAKGGWTIERHGAGGQIKGNSSQQEDVRIVRMASNAVNCINPAFLDDLNATLDTLEHDNVDHPSPVVFASASEKTFCAGLDLKTVSAMSRDELTHFIHRLNESYVRLLTLNCPTVAAVNGHAIAGGALLALSADYRVSPSTGKGWFGVNEVRLGIPFPTGPWAVMRYVAASRPRLNELILSGELVSLHDAHSSYGLIDHALPSTLELTQGSVEYVQRVVHRHSWRAFAAVKAAAQRPWVERYHREKRDGDIDHTFVDIFFSDAARNAIRERLASIKA